MNKLEAKQMNEEIRAALEPIFAKHGMSLDKSGLRYGELDVTVRLTATVRDDEGYKVLPRSTMERAKEVLSNFSDSRFSNIPAEEIFKNEVWVLNVGWAKIVDYNSRRRTYPFSIVSRSGSRYKTTTQLIKLEY